MIEIQHLSFKYPHSTELVLKNINLLLKPHTVTLITGASGSGKSTLLRCINGLVPHFSGGTITGSINVFGSDPIKEGPQVLSSKVGFVFQEPESQFTFDIVEDEIAFALENVGMPRVQMRERVESILQEMGLLAIRDEKVHNISGGEKQKVAIASALVSQPEVLILDEPTSQLDPHSADEILQYIVSLKVERNLTVLIAEHRLERLLHHADNVAHLASDKNLFFGPPQVILTKMDQVPPVIQIGKQLDLSPLPLTTETFPSFEVSVSNKNEIDMPSQKNKAILVIEQLNTFLADKHILHDISMRLNEGELLTLMGSNGAGKTTLLRSILGLIPSEGQKSLLGRNLDDMVTKEVIDHIAYLPQNPNDLLFAETVLDELKITLKNHHYSVDEKEILLFLERFGLADKADRYPRDLSVGERQRTALAAITVHEPKIILLDEPTRGMDYQDKDALAALLWEWRDQNKAIVLATHDVEFAAKLADRVVFLKGGKIRYAGSPQKFFSKFPDYQTQVAKIFPKSSWFKLEDVNLKDLQKQLK